ncbi:hypothetical protein LPO95_000010 [Vibrio cholerae]|nr:hypothetical protein [Vibrio cholerae]
MRKLPTLIRYAKHIFLILTLPLTMDASGAEIFLRTDEPGYYSLDRIFVSFSELNTAMSEDTNWGGLRGHNTTIRILTANGLYLWYRCEHPANTAGDGQEVKYYDLQDPIRQDYIKQAVNHLNTCSWIPIETVNIINSDDFTVTEYNLYYEDQYNEWDRTSGVLFKYLTMTLEHSSSCHATITNNILFGKLTTHGKAEARGTISVQCDSDADINISVNNGRPLLSSDGAKIAFVYDSSLQVLGAKPYEVIITADMNQTPSQPGSYQWAVPVKITYE